MQDLLYTPPIIIEQFFNFEFTLQGWELIETTMDWKKIKPAIWESLYIVKQKYDKKNRTAKQSKKTLENKQKKYCEDLEKWRKDKEYLQEHIRRVETKLCEYKNTILAFGKLATCNSISK